jgi:hypothetical protein
LKKNWFLKGINNKFSMPYLIRPCKNHDKSHTHNINKMKNEWGTSFTLMKIGQHQNHLLLSIESLSLGSGVYEVHGGWIGSWGVYFFFSKQKGEKGNQCNFFSWAWSLGFPPAVECSVWTITIVWEGESVTTAPPKCKLVKPLLSSIWFADYYRKRIRTHDY